MGCMHVSQAFTLCNQFHGHNVRIHTNDGLIHVGTIVRVDQNHVFVRTFGENGCGGRAHVKGEKAQISGFWGWNNAIIPLSLFTLLAIALI
ncbi:hypothetical protein NV379_04225 [Paenibacillus sp. N1-5-1-14]|uniref:hypothetical protein n=1 Tax=Paenibacillus radicibacter TaxID=2972488 RepID=UPI0021592B98|nr:hypothetical protein [Paenibacillus radicibacter]MCR8641859.1 hypothetical protein [Paenibacillus radicibacter]